jgi:hypothetical protein
LACRRQHVTSLGDFPVPQLELRILTPTGYKGVRIVLQWCYSCVTLILQRCYRGYIDKKMNFCCFMRTREQRGLRPPCS